MSIIVDIEQMLKDNGCQYWILKHLSSKLGTHVVLIKESNIKKIDVSANKFSITGIMKVKSWDKKECKFTDYSYSGELSLHESNVNSDSFTNHPQILEILSKKYPSKKHGSDFVEGLKILTNDSCEIVPPIPPAPGGDEQSDKTCSNTGQFGGGGTPLKDIKLSLFVNNVTKGNIKLSKPQLEIGTFATDWRPNPSDYVHANNSKFKRINGIALQHSDSSGKNYLEIQTKDGFAFGIDTWGGAQKLLEQQQKEIEELKKIVQTLESKINV